VKEALRLLDKGAVLGVVLNGHDRVMRQYEKYYELDALTASRVAHR
jgi:hypothetical protein